MDRKEIEDFSSYIANSPLDKWSHVSYQFTSLILYLVEESLKSKKSDVQAIPPGFITLRKFIDDTDLVSSEWLTSVFRTHEFPSGWRKINNIWFVHKDKIIHWFVDNKEAYPIMASRCKKYLKRIKK